MTEVLTRKLMGSNILHADEKVTPRHRSRSSPVPFADSSCLLYYPLRFSGVPLFMSILSPLMVKPSGDLSVREGKKFEFSDVEFDLQSANIKVRRPDCGREGIGPWKEDRNERSLPHALAEAPDTGLD